MKKKESSTTINSLIASFSAKLNIKMVPILFQRVRKTFLETLQWRFTLTTSNKPSYDALFVFEAGFNNRKTTPLSTSPPSIPLKHLELPEDYCIPLAKDFVKQNRCFKKRIERQSVDKIETIQHGVQRRIVRRWESIARDIRRDGTRDMCSLMRTARVALQTVAGLAASQRRVVIL